MRQWRMLKRFCAFSLLMLLPLSAYAVSMGRITVQSALGTPFRAEIPLKDLAGIDTATLSAKMAGASAFKQAGIPYVAALYAIHFKIDTRPGATSRIVLTSSRSVSNPFLSLLVELQWPSGRLLREYTVLLDPPGYGGKREAITPIALPSTLVSVTKQVPIKPRAAVTLRHYGPVKRGDTLFSIANRLKPVDVTSQQMLVALYRRNPSAFMGYNMNRLMAGRVLMVPRAGDVAAISRQNAVREIRRQAVNWRAYRRRLAAAATIVAARKAARQTAIGKITSVVNSRAEKQKPASDVLKLSRGVVAGSTGAAGLGGEQSLKQKIQSLQEDAIAREKTIQDANARIAALEKTIKDMRRLLTLKGEVLPAQPVKKVVPKPKIVPKPVLKPRVVPSLFERIIDNPVYRSGGAAGVVLLLALALWGIGRARRRRTRKFVRDTGAKGDSPVSTIIAKTAGGPANADTSFLTDFSQTGLGTIDTNDVDPIAEADVYIAYGRDGQAEEILKEAMGKEPHRYDVHLKLLEIYAARKDLAAFNALAVALHTALGGQQGPLWDKTVQMGRALDPENTLYQQEVDSANTVIISPEVVAETRAMQLSNDVNTNTSATEAESALDSAPSEPELSPLEDALSPVVDASLDGVSMDDILEMDGLAEMPAADVVDLNAPLDIDLGGTPVAVDAAAQATESLSSNIDGIINPVAPGELPLTEEVIPHDEVSGLQEEVVADSSAVDEAPIETLAPDGISSADETMLASEVAELQEEVIADPSTVDEVLTETMALEEVQSADEATLVSEVAESREEVIADPSTVDEVLTETIMPEEISSAEDATLSSEAAALQEEVVLADASPAGEDGAEMAALEDASSVEEVSPEAEIPELAEAATPSPGETVGDTKAALSFASEETDQGDAQISPLDLDFSLDEAEEAAPEPSSPPLDLAGIDLDLDALPTTAESMVEEVAESDTPRWQESATKLDLARAYMEMGDSEGAREILDEVVTEGNVKQRQDAKDLLAQLS